jgi:AraC-like DNA-binding protein
MQSTVARIFRAQAPRVYFDPDLDVYLGYETRTDPAEYFWPGLKRGGDPNHPYIIYQYTLDGWGIYREGKSSQRVLPGMAFTAFVPSDHEYFLPPESKSWTFFWLSLRHPYTVARMRKRMLESGRLLVTPPDSVLAASMVSLFEGVCYNMYRDAFALEQAQLELLIEYERFGHQLVYAQPVRASLLDETRAYVLKRLHAPITIEELAQRRDMRRSHFAHYYQAATGLAPAKFVLDVRLREAEQRLIHTRDKLGAIARECGFADDNHFCKVFRRHYHVTPGNFRKQLRPS